LVPVAAATVIARAVIEPVALLTTFTA